MKKFLIFTAAALLSAGVLGAQMEDWSWDAYKTSFKVPGDFKITKHDDKVFSAENKAIRLSIFPQKLKNTPDAAKLGENLVKWVDTNKITYKVEDIDSIPDLNGYSVAYIEGVKDKKQVFAGLFFNPADDKVLLYVMITYTQADYDTALEMLKSFAPKAE